MSEVPKRYRLIGADGQPYESDRQGVFGGNTLRPGDRIYGRLDCPSALRALGRRGRYEAHRVFFASEADAVAAGFRPCGTCLRPQYRAWKAGSDRASAHPAAGTSR